MSALDSPGTLVVPVHRDQSLVVLGSEPRGVLLDARGASALIDVASEIVWVGRVGERACFAIDVSQVERPETHVALAGRGEFADLRMAGGLLPAEEAEVLAYARGMLYWHRRHRYCGSCGRPTKPREGG